MKFLAGPVLALLFSALLLAGCGGSEKPPGGPVPGPSGEGAAPAPPPIAKAPAKEVKPGPEKAPPKEPAPAGAKTELEGAWHVVAAEKQGQKDDAMCGEFVFRGSNVSLQEGRDNPVMKATFKSDPGASPKTIDIQVPVPGGTLSIRGIYLLEGDSLKISAPEKPGGPRPTDFTTRPGDGFNLIIFQRGPMPAEAPKPPPTAEEAAVKLYNAFKQITLAEHNYHDTFRRFAPQAIRGKDGKPLLSWRVSLLPYLEYGPLYDKFHLDEPWDSPHNKQFLEMMPDVYKAPGVDEPGMTSVVVFTGEGTPFGGEKGPKQFDFKDGLGKTIMIVLAKPDKAVPWTKPEDLPFDKEDPLAALQTIAGDEILLGMADGNVVPVEKSIDPEVLRRLIQHQDGKKVVPEDLGKAAPRVAYWSQAYPVKEESPPPAETGPPAAAGPPSIRELAQQTEFDAEQGYPKALCFSPDGSRLATLGADGSIKTWDRTGRLQHKLEKEGEQSKAIAFSPDSKLLASALAGSGVRLWDAGSGRSAVKLTAPEQVEVTALAFSPDGRALLTADRKGLVEVWGVAERKPLTKHGPFDEGVAFLAFSPDGHKIFRASGDGVRFIEEDKTDTMRLDFPSPFTTCFSMSQNGQTLCVGMPRKLHVVELGSGKQRSIDTGGRNVFSVAVSPDGRVAATGLGSKPDPNTGISEQAPREFVLWDLATGDALQTLSAHTKRVGALAFTSDGSMLASGSSDGRVILWATGLPAAKPAPTAEPVAKTPPKSAARNWTSADGKFHVEATLVKMVAGVVHLQRADNGQEIEIPIDKLSQADQDFLRTR